MALNRRFIIRHWYAYVYEQCENQTNDVNFLLRVTHEQLGGELQNVLEVGCGGGRILVPIAQAGHTTTGFDRDEQMLLRCYKRMTELPNSHCYRADAITSDWGGEFDIVVLAANLLLNIESSTDYAECQRLLITKAAASLRPGGHLYLDFDLHSDPTAFFSRLGETSYFGGTDDLGTSGRTLSYGSVYDPVTQFCTGTSHWELTLNSGEHLIVPELWHKHIPTQAQVYGWLGDAGFEIERTYTNFTDEPLANPVANSCRATLWARKD